jgi:putative membrane protein
MRHLLLTGGLGLALLLGLLCFYGVDDIARLVAAIGWGLALIVGLRFAKVAGAAEAWSYLFPRGARMPLGMLYGLRLVREGVNTLLPVAQVGGEFVGARLASHSGLSLGEAGASIAVDLLSQACTQAVFTIAGLVVLASLGSAPALVREIALALLALIPGLVGFFAVQRFGGFGWVERQFAKIAERIGWLSVGKMPDLDANLKRLYRDRRALAKNAGLHLVLWFAGSAEIYVALKCLGEAVSWSEATVIESLALALRSATFVMPASLGVQEGAMIAICAVFGLSAPIALAVSLSKRLAEIVVGVVGLMIWQIFERSILSRRAARLPTGAVSGDADAAVTRHPMASSADELTAETPLPAK